MALTLTREGVVLAAVMMRKGGNRARLLILIGGAPHDDQHFHALSTRTAARILGVSVRHVHDLLAQLVAAGVLERRAGAGSRADAWRVRGDVRRWSVLWPKRRDPDHVRLILADAGHLIDVADVAPPTVARASIAERGATFARAFMAEQSPRLSRANGSAREVVGLRALPEARATPSSSSDAAGFSSHPSGNGGERRRSDVELYVGALAGVVYESTGRPTIGRGLDQLATLHGRLPIDRARQALTVLPANAGWPMVVAALRLAAETPGPASNGHHVSVRYSWTDAEGRVGVRADDFATQAEADARAADLRAGIGWPLGAARLEVDEPV